MSLQRATVRLRVVRSLSSSLLFCFSSHGRAIGRWERSRVGSRAGSYKSCPPPPPQATTMYKNSHNAEAMVPAAFRATRCSRLSYCSFQSYLYFSQHFSGGSSKHPSISGGACIGFSMIDFSAHRTPPEISRPDLNSDTLGLQVGCETLKILENSKNYEIPEESKNSPVPV